MLGAIKAQVFAADGSRSGSEILVNTATAGNQTSPQISVLNNGRFVVTWTDGSLGVGGAGGDTASNAIKAQLFAADGTRIGGEVLVNTATAGSQSSSQIVALANGGYVITWSDSSQGVGGAGGDTSGSAIKAQIFAADGTRTGGEILLNQFTFNSQSGVQITALANGGFAAVWFSANPFYSMGIFNADGSRVGGEYSLGFPSSNSGTPVIASLSNGNIVVSWYDADAGLGTPSGGGDGSGFAVKALLVDPAGNYLNNTTVNIATVGDQEFPRIIPVANGNYVITWTDFGSGAGGATGDTDGSVRGQLFDSTGNRIGGEFLINSATAGTQSLAQVAVLASGDFVIAWRDASLGVGGAPGDNSGTAIKAQLFSVAYHAINDVPLDLKGHLAIADVDGGNGVMTVTLSVSTGVLDVHSGTSGATVSNNASSSVTITGTQLQIDALFLTDGTSSVDYRASGAAAGSGATLTLSVNDNGNTGGGALTATTSYGIVIAPNIAPGGSDATITFLEDHVRVLNTADFGFTDANLGHLQAVKIATLPAAGTLYFDADGAGPGVATAVTAGQLIAATDIAAGKLSFVPAPNGNGAGYASLTFQVQDDGGTANGGVNLDPTPNTLTFNVTDVYDPPATFPSVIHLSTIGADGFAIIGDVANDFAGTIVSRAGDVNGDGLADYIVASSGADLFSMTNAGAVYVLYGKPTGFGTLDLSNFGATDGFRLVGEQSGDSLAASAAAGDVNGDGYADLIVGAPGNSGGGAGAGAAYVLFGQADTSFKGGQTYQVPPFGPSNFPDFKIQGDNAGDNAGASVAGVGDVNGDGFADLLIGAAGNDSGGTDAGAAYLIFGKASGFGPIDLTSLAAADGVKFQGAAAGDRAGGSVAAAGDINGDGRADFIIGAAANDAGGTDAGAAYVIFGKTSAFSPVVNLGTLAATDGFRIQGTGAAGAAGISVASAGDINHDGYADLIVGATGVADGGVDAGAAYVVFGKASGFGTVLDLATLGAAQGFKIIGDLASDRAGVSVASAGDVNGDGYDDIIIGASGSGSAAGSAYVIFGKASGFGTIDLSNLTPGIGFAIVADTAGDNAGRSVSAAGDINGDGYGDILVGAARNDVGGTDAGAAYVIFGRSNISVFAKADSFTATDNLVTALNVVANDDVGAVVASVNGTELIVGQSLNLASGASVTLNADGTLGYNSNHAFGALTAVAGASNSVAHDSFTYKLTGGGSATVGVTITGNPTSNAHALGTAGNDTLIGTDSADYFDLSQGGNDTASGNGGNDTFFFGAALTAADQINAGTGTGDQIVLQGNYAGTGKVMLTANSIVGVEALMALSGFSYDITTHDGNVAAGQTLLVDASALGANDSFTFNGAAETDGNFRINGGSGIDNITGGAGADILDGGAGADTMIGGLGNDIYYVDSANDVVTESGSGGTDEVRTTLASYTLAANVENLTGLLTTAQTLTGNALDNVITGGIGNDELFGGAGNDVIEGGAGNDILHGGTGLDTVRGGAGNDELDIDSSTDAVAGEVYDGGDGVDSIVLRGFDADLSGATLTAIERIDTLGHTATLTGAQLAGFAQIGAASPASIQIGANVVLSDSGAVTLTSQLSSLGLTIDLAAGGNRLDLSGMTTTSSNARFYINGHDGDDVVIGGKTGNVLNGGAGSDTLVGGAGIDILDGGTGADRLFGGLGNDIYHVDRTDDLVFENAGEGADGVITTASYYLFANIEDLTLATGAGDIFGVGNELANAITGNEGSNLLIAGAGDDVVHGGGGVDSLFGQDGNDQLFGDAGVDYLVGGTGDDMLDGGTDADALYGEDGNDVLWGGTDFQTDILVGGAGNDILHGDSGLGDYDLMDGGSGDDTYYVDTPADLTFEAVGGGTDTVHANIIGAGYYLYANVENLILDGITPFGVGNELNNQLTGNASSNYLLGGAGDDILNGKVGNDVLFGEAGADTFMFEHGTGADVIGDFAAGTDKIDLTAIGYTWQQVLNSLHENGGNTAIDLGGGDLIVLNGVTAAQLHASDFILAGGTAAVVPAIGRSVGIEGFGIAVDAAATHLPPHVSVASDLGAAARTWAFEFGCDDAATAFAWHEAAAIPVDIALA